MRAARAGVSRTRSIRPSPEKDPAVRCQGERRFPGERGRTIARLDPVEIEERHTLDTLVRRRRKRSRGSTDLESRVVPERRLGDVAQPHHLDGLAFQRQPHPRSVHVALSSGRRRTQEQNATAEKRVPDHAPARLPLHLTRDDGALRGAAEQVGEPLEGPRGRGRAGERSHRRDHGQKAEGADAAPEVHAHRRHFRVRRRRSSALMRQHLR
jgi:hypothetical protein